MLECSDGSLYTGYTSDIERRISQHQSGVGCKYTRVRLPIELVYKENFEKRSDAMKREREIKRLSRLEKLKLKDF